MVYHAAANVDEYNDRLGDDKPPVVTYKSKLVYKICQFPSNAKGASTAAKPTKSSALSDSGETSCLHMLLVSMCIQIDIDSAHKALHCYSLLAIPRAHPTEAASPLQ